MKILDRYLGSAVIGGTLLTLAGDGESPEKVSEILEARDSYRSEMTAPARGLFLHKVLYGEEVERGVY